MPGAKNATVAAGKYIRIQHADGYQTQYLHLSEILVKPGTHVYAGTLIGKSGDTGAAAGHPHLHFEVKKGGISVDPYGWEGSGPDPYRAAVNQLLWSGTPSLRPANDNFAGATVIKGSSVTVRGSNVHATKESGEPSHAGYTGGTSVWWSWTAPSSGWVTVDTHGSSFDTLMGVYTGTSVTALKVVASNANASSSDLTSQASFYAKAGATFRIAVDGYAAASGNVSLHLKLVPIPGAPTGLSWSRVAGTPNEIVLSWKDTSDNETGFRLDYWSNLFGWQSYKTVGANVTSTTSHLATTGVVYVRVVAFNAFGEFASVDPPFVGVHL